VRPVVQAQGSEEQGHQDQAEAPLASDIANAPKDERSLETTVFD